MQLRGPRSYAPPGEGRGLCLEEVTLETGRGVQGSAREAWERGASRRAGAYSGRAEGVGDPGRGALAAVALR